MHIITYSAEAAPTGFEFLAVITHGTEFHPVTPFRSSVSAEDAREKAEAWWNEQIAIAAKKAENRAAMSGRRRKPQAEVQLAPEIEEAF